MVEIIAEIGINHGGDVEKAKKMIKAAKRSGADTVKFQSYTTEKRVSKDNPAFDILKKCELSFEEQRELKKYADEIDVGFLSTPFDVENLEFLIFDLRLKRIKIASFDTTNLEFLREVNKYPEIEVLMSVGMTDMQELVKATKCLCMISNLTLLYCKSAYPLNETDVNLDCINTLKLFGSGKVGYSNHVKNTLIPALSVVAGAKIVEAHFMLDFDSDCVDLPVSLDEIDFEEMVEQIRRFEKILGSAELKLEKCEEGTKLFKRYSK